MPEKKDSSVVKSKLKSRQKRMFYIVLTCNILAAFLGFTAVAIGIVSAASVDWSHYDESNMTGLFRGCNKGGDCFTLEGGL